MDDSKTVSGVHRLYLIRHGETVDNVAGLYAGVRDSALTNHGLQQAQRLGQYFGKSAISFDHIFSSDLSRAVRTAEAICTPLSPTEAQKSYCPRVVQLKELQEQNFGYYEGKSFHARSPDSRKSGRDQHRDKHKDEAGFQDIETKESMAKRADKFLDEHLMPLLKNMAETGSTVAVVSHGMLLSSLWRCMLRRQSPSSIKFDSIFTTETRPTSLEHLGGWSNTGYLEIELSSQPAAEAESQETEGAVAVSSSEAAALVTGDSQATEQSHSEHVSVEPASPTRYSILIKTINGKEHLKGLKRTGGGVGSSKHDEGQKTIQSFFKRQKT